MGTAFAEIQVGSISMNKLQKKEYEILVQFDKLCKDNHLQYFLAYGTALGAVRHGGFIPWDDDMDVVMLRDEYEKLCSLPYDCFPRNLKLRTVYTEVEHPYLFAKLCDINTTYIEENAKHLNISHGVFIDIFPLDYAPHNSFARFIQRCYAEYAWLVMAKYRNATRLGKCAAAILNVGYTDEKYVSRIRRIEKKICGGCGKTEKVVLLSFGLRSEEMKQYFATEWFSPAEIKFETGSFSIMEGYDAYLKMVYGNYMELPPEEERISSHYAAEIDLDKPCKVVDRRG